MATPDQPQEAIELARERPAAILAAELARAESEIDDLQLRNASLEQLVAMDAAQIAEFNACARVAAD